VHPIGRDKRFTFNRNEVRSLKKHTLSKTLAALSLAVAASSALADRPMVTDAAGVGDPGTGNLKLWYTDAEGNGLTTVAGAFVPLKNIELSGSVANGSGLSVTAIAGKWMITPTQNNGCNFAATLGWSRVKVDGAGSANGTGVNGIATCNRSVGTMHANLGYSKPSGASGVTTWGLAFERSFGVLTPNIEVFGTNGSGSDTTVQLGLRGDITKNLQLDGSVGWLDNATIYTVGVKFSF
jgi:hypothetical protein